MKTNLIILAVFLTFAQMATASLGKATHRFSPTEETVGINFFTGTWQEALLEAKAKNKIIFLDAYASWCGPCKVMSNTTFKDAQVGAYFNANFINYKMDMEKNPDGKRLSTKFKLEAYPTLYFVNASEIIVFQKLGMHQAKEFLEIGKTVIATKK
jgi:thiol:disulfide interchange protein